MRADQDSASLARADRATMTAATNIDATAVNTIAWLGAAATTIVVPVYQRQYRWDIGGCEQLLNDIRAVADQDDLHMHFIGSILSTSRTQDAASELVLIDGQQRLTTLMLLVAALRHSVADSDAQLSSQLDGVLVHPRSTVTKLRPHRAWADTFEDVILDRDRPHGRVLASRFDDNYAFFRSQIGPDEVARIWRGLQKLEHVAITLGAGANAQQIFASLNSTGEPLRDHELIHNYVLMGLSHAQQSEIEDSFWVPIDENTGEHIGGFWRHYLVMITGREVAATSEHGVYDAFRERFPRLDFASLREHAAQWREFSAIYRILLDPAAESDAEIARHLAHVNTFGRGVYPLVMRVSADLRRGAVDRAFLIATLERIQAMLLRRTVVGLSVDRLVARLCRAERDGPESLSDAMARITPSDERVRIAVKFEDLPHAAYVLGRLAGLDTVAGLHIEHIVPVVPGDAWTGDGDRPWAAYTEDEQNSHRALSRTLGNLTLLEEALADRAVEASFPVKRDDIYPRSAVIDTAALTDVAAWTTTAIAARTARLTAALVRIWPRENTVPIDDDGLTPILDAVARRGWPRGWEGEFEYIEYRGEHWEVHDVKYLFNRVFKRLWADAREHVVAFSSRRGGPIYAAAAWNGQWDALDESNHLYMGWDAKYMLTALQGVLDEAGLAREVFVKYSYTAAAM